MSRYLFLILSLLCLLLSFSVFAGEISAGFMYSFSGNYLFSGEFNTLGLIKNAPNAVSGFSLALITDFANYYISLGGIAKYDIKLEIGTVSLFGMGGMLAPINGFGFEKITSIIRIGAKYYFGDISITSGLFSFYLIDNTKVEGIEFSIGYIF
ncbi:hypothetical protein [Fervidobacterium nodosum]|uniref:Outer membrane protein beta-barrel domain-containing protein n=1 Tax=Fervidobacterium nodosum (strain ATCC 35602 / DSM 5306 / Rt17-B1) TaxID=381764 RepID=A7HKX7_FERNB|nr:hypothetical protein [Fervidobacterium nodosum]ABS60560.1 hypothetical protein Fnod_0705 [Fervidobacterium nodosum Rt17-B1]PHJ14137.1 hypothetical protein IM41_02435 [Fervidobacterium sp. SC_NGM5_G05]